MPATIRKRPSKKLDRNGNPIIRYQVRWLNLSAMNSEHRQASSDRPAKLSTPNVKPKHAHAESMTSWNAAEASIRPVRS